MKAKDALARITYKTGYIFVIKFIIDVYLNIYLSKKEEKVKDTIQSLLKELEDLTRREGNKVFFIEALIIQGLLMLQ